MRGWKMCAAAVALLCAVALAGCRGMDLRAEIDSRRVTIPGVAQIAFGGVSVNFLPAGGSLDLVSVTPIGETDLAASSLRVFDDVNGDGVWNEGEPVHRFVGTEAGGGFEVTDVTLTAGQVRGWNRPTWQIDITDADGGKHVVSEGL